MYKTLLILCTGIGVLYITGHTNPIHALCTGVIQNDLHIMYRTLLTLCTGVLYITGHTDPIQALCTGVIQDDLHIMYRSLLTLCTGVF